MTSSRLPDKSLRQLAGKPIIQRCYEQCKKATVAQIVVVAIPTGSGDDPLYEFCVQNNIPVFRGHPTNLAKRYFDCARQLKISTIIRITGDNPLIDPRVIDKVYNAHVKQSGDYTSTRHWTGEKLIGLYPKGLSVDVFGIESLAEMMRADLSKEEREHIVFYFCNNEKRLKRVEVAPEHRIDYSFTVDTPEDFWRISKLVEFFEKQGLEFSYENYVKYVVQSA